MEASLLSIFACVQLLAIAFVSIYFISRRNSHKNPPVYSGWIPWLGCAIEFGSSPLDFIERMRKELAAVYTLYVAGERLTFLTDSDDFHHFFLSNNVDFQKAVQDPVQNVASVSQKSFFLYHTKIHDLVKGRLASSRLVHFSGKLQAEFERQLNCLGASGNAELFVLVRQSMYRSVMNNLFGENTLPTDDQELFELTEKHFVKFDEQFEYGARLPPFFIKEWSNAKQYLLKMFRNVIQKVGKSQKSIKTETLLESVINLVDTEHAANYGLLLLWASLANAVPITFWCLVYILANTDVKLKLIDQIETAIKKQQNEGGKIEFNDSLFREMPYLKWCVLEAIRLHPVGIITRRVTKPFRVKYWTVPAGDMLMLSPFWAHRDPRFFTNPTTYNPDRWQDADLEKNLFLDGFVAFGGGRYQCPGRWYALMEIQMFVAMFLWKFDCSLEKNQVPKYNGRNLVGTQHPLEPCIMQYSIKQH